MNKGLLFSALIALFCFQLSAKVVVISDIDDTIKKANSANGSVGQAYHFLRKRIYPEMRDMFIELKSSYEKQGEQVDFFYVSAAPDVLFNQDKWLSKHNFPAGQATLRAINGGDSYSYKKRVIGKILENVSSSDTVYFFGDNASKDAIVYTDLVKELGLVNNFIYIRDVTTFATTWNSKWSNHRINGAHYYFSEAEFIHESLGGGLFFLSAKLGVKIQKAYDNKELIPEYTYKVLRKRVRDENDCRFLDFSCYDTSCAYTDKLWSDYHSKY